MFRQYRIKIKGTSPIIQNNGAAGLDTRSPDNREKALLVKKKGSNRTEPDDVRIRELDCKISLYFSADGKPTLPEAAPPGLHRNRNREN